MVERPWWWWHPPVEVSLECSGTIHRLRWEAGELAAVDHQDPRGERTLGALGGQQSSCIALLDSWIRHREDLRVLTLASRGPGDRIPQVDPRAARLHGGAPHHGPAPTFPGPTSGRTASGQWAGWSGYTPLGAHSQPARPGQAGRPFPTEAQEDELALLLRFDPGLSDRLQATVVAAWVGRLEVGDARADANLPGLTAALYGRLLRPLQEWWGDRSTPVEVGLSRPGEAPSVVRADGILKAQLPLRWLLDVWGRGMAVVLDRFVVEVLDESEDTCRLAVVNRDLNGIDRVTIELD